MNEFKKIKNNNETRYVLETMTAGATGVSAIATAEKDIGEVQKRIPDTSKPRNFVVKNAKMGGAGKMKDKSKTIPRKEKHKKPVAEGVSDLSYDAQSLITKLRRDVEEKRLQPTAQAVLAAARELAGDMDFAPQLLVKQVLGQGVAEGLQARLAELKNKVKEAYGRYDRRDAYQRDYDSSVSGMDRGNDHRDDERHDLDPTDWYFVKDGKMFAISIYPNQEREATARGYSRTRAEAKAKASEQGVAEGASDFVGDAIEALRSSVPGLKQQDFLDELYMYIENQYGQRAAEMMSNAGQDDYDDWYDSYLDNPEQGMAEVDTYMESLAESLQQVLSEKAVSKKQQKFMGMVHAAQKGEKPASKEVAKVAKDMGKKDAKDFAATKHKGLPEKKKSKK